MRLAISSPNGYSPLFPKWSLAPLKRTLPSSEKLLFLNKPRAESYAPAANVLLIFRPLKGLRAANPRGQDG